MRNYHDLGVGYDDTEVEVDRGLHATLEGKGTELHHPDPVQVQNTLFQESLVHPSEGVMQMQKGR